MDIHDIQRFPIIAQPFSDFWLVGSLQISFPPLAQTSSYAGSFDAYIYIRGVAKPALYMSRIS